MARTALAEALKRAGGPSEEDVALDSAIALWMNKGRSFDEYVARGWAAYGLPDDGQSMFAAGHRSGAAVRQADGEEEGQEIPADEATTCVPSTSPTDGEAGHTSRADGQTSAARPADKPLRRMTLVQQTYRGADGTFHPRPQTPGAIAASAHAARSAAVTVLDTFKVRGRAVGDVYMSEIGELRAASIIEASVLLQIQRHATFDPTTNPKVRDVVKVADLQRFIQRGAEVADAS